MQRSEADWAGWVWVDLELCKVRCMSMLWRERQEQGRRSGEPGTCPAPASICQQATCWSSPGPPSATCGFSPRLLSVTLDHLGPLQDTALAHLRAINSTIPPEISVKFIYIYCNSLSRFHIYLRGMVGWEVIYITDMGTT